MMNNIQSTTENSQRSQLQSNQVNTWLRKRYYFKNMRHFQKVKKQYLLFPEQIKQEQEIRKIFQNFDKDNSNNLDIGEMYDMFQKYGFQVTEKQLKNFFQVVDKDKDNALNWDEFKNSVFDEDASKIFYNIIKEIRKQDSQTLTKNYGYVPFQFNDMISYLNFLTSRNELQDSIKLDSLSSFEKFQKYMKILKLNQEMRQGYNSEMKSIQEEKKEETIIEHEFTKDHQNKYNHSKSSFYNKSDLPILMKLKTQTKRKQEINMKNSLEFQQTFLSNPLSWQSLKKQDKHLNLQQQQNNHLLFLNNSSPTKNLTLNKSSQNSKYIPYLQLNLNAINSNYREDNLNQDFKDDLDQSRLDRLPTQLIQELQSFKRLSGQTKLKDQMNLRTSPNRTSQNYQKSITSLMKTSAELNPNSQSLSKLCTPRQRDDKIYTQRRTINRPILQNYSSYSNLEKHFNLEIQGKTLQFK